MIISQASHIEKKENKIFLPQKVKTGNVRILRLKEYIQNNFVGCGLPPLNQFLDLNIQGEFVEMILENVQQLFPNEQEEWVYHIFQGRLWLEKQQNNRKDDEDIQKPRKSSYSLQPNEQKNEKAVTKLIQVKENSFFTLRNYKKILEPYPQIYKIKKWERGEISGRCLVGRVKLSEKYGLNWYQQESRKYIFLNKIFNTQQNQIPEHKIKGLSRFFKTQSIRRRTVLTEQNKKAEKLMILFEGQCQLSKNLHYEDNNMIHQKALRIASGGLNSVLGGEFILFQAQHGSKQIENIIKSFNEHKFCQFFFSSSGLSNFSNIVNSAFANFYTIPITKFKELCERYIPQAPSNLMKNIENWYITLLRTCEQKLYLQNARMQRNNRKKKQDRQLFEARLQAGQFSNDKEKKQVIQSSNDKMFRNSQTFQVSKAELKAHPLKSKSIGDTRQKRVEKKIKIILEEKKPEENYKKKIQKALHDKLMEENKKDSKHSSESSQARVPVKQTITKNIISDLEEIFMNDEKSNRTQSIHRHKELLEQKQQILKRRYNSMNNLLVVHQECYNKNNKLYRIDLLKKGAMNSQLKQTSRNNKNQLNNQNFSTRIKNQFIEKINKTNKIREQFMKIYSECQHCYCYDSIDQKPVIDLKAQTMKTGSAWRSTPQKQKHSEQPLQKIHSRQKFLNEKTTKKYDHNKHLLKKRKSIANMNKRRLSAPMI